MKAVKKETEHKVCICVWKCGSVKVRLTIDLPCLLLQRWLQKNWLSHCLISFSWVVARACVCTSQHVYIFIPIHPQAWTILYPALPLLLDESVAVNHLWNTHQPARDQLVSYPLPFPFPHTPTHLPTHFTLSYSSLFSITVQMWPLRRWQGHSCHCFRIGSQLCSTSLEASTCSSPCGCW